MPAATFAGLPVALVHCLCGGTGRIPVPAKYRAALGAVVSCSLHSVPAPAADVCPACSGTLRVVDSDGTLSGTIGVLVPCDCVGHLYGQYGACPCHVDVWNENDGNTGWEPIPLEEFTDDGPYFRPCTEHTPNMDSVLAVAA